MFEAIRNCEMICDPIWAFVGRHQSFRGVNLELRQASGKAQLEFATLPDLHLIRIPPISELSN